MTSSDMRQGRGAQPWVNETRIRLNSLQTSLQTSVQARPPDGSQNASNGGKTKDYIAFGPRAGFHPAGSLAGVLAAAALALLAGCADMASRTPAGAPFSEVQAAYGPPDYRCALPDGRERVVWTQQPMGQYAWGANVGPDGRIDQIQRLLTHAHFRVLDHGAWSADRLRCEFGPPAMIRSVGLPATRQIVWSYRYRENEAWNSLMHIYMGPAGERMTRRHPGPDPMYDADFGFGRD